MRARRLVHTNKVDRMPLPACCVLAPPVPYKARMRRAPVAHATAELVGLMSSRHADGRYMHIYMPAVRRAIFAKCGSSVFGDFGHHQVYTKVTISSL